MNWDKKYLKLAKEVSTWSKDPRKQVGAVVVEKDHVRGVGYNGFPRGIKHTPERLRNKSKKNKIMVHAEVNAMIASGVKGDTIYVWPCLPCSQCMGLIIQAGLTRIVTGPLDDNTAWDQELAIEIAEEAQLSVTIIEET